MAEDQGFFGQKPSDVSEEAERSRKTLENFGTELYNTVNLLNNLAMNVNKTFGQMKERVSEINEEIAKATPRLNELGGSAQDAQEAISQIALATRRNVVATSESVAELYATSQVLGRDINSIVSAMADVGTSFENVEESLLEGTKYVQSIGQNVQQVMQDVLDNTDLLNKANFEGGVLGLTKMAAQSALLRVNMRDTMNFADQAMDPEGAIKLAATFQRLGVTMGTLADPFALMNASINDPQGLQKSLAEMAKNYTEFDEKTKSFKMNPEGIRILREISKQTGQSYENLSKMGLAAANSERIMSQMRFGGNLTEEQRMYIASMAQLSGDTGEYVIKVKDETGREYFEKLTNVNEQQLKQAIKSDEEKPKSMEEIARSQLTVGEKMGNDIAAIRNRIMGGIAGAQPLRELPIITDKIYDAAADALKKIAPTTEGVKDATEKSIAFLKDNLVDVLEGRKGMGEVGAELITKLKQQGIDVAEDKLSKIPDQLMNSLHQKFKNDQTTIGKEIATRLAPGAKGREDFVRGFTSTTGLSKISEMSGGRKITETKQVNHSGTVRYVVELQGGADPDLKRKFQTYVESPEFLQSFMKKTGETPDATGQTMKVKLKQD